MSAAAEDRNTLEKLVWLAAVLVVVRSAVWLIWEQSYFDSDQAVFGLMTRHLVSGRASLLFMYGQRHGLAVDAWMAAPLFRMFGSSVGILRLPLLVVNLVVAVLLLRILVKDAGLRPVAAFASSLFFVLPPPAASSRLLEVGAGNLEPFLYTLLLWMTRSRPVLFGLIAGFGFIHREFTAYAVAALLLVEWRNGQLFTMRNLRAKCVAGGAAAAVFLAVAALQPYADAFGPHTAGRSSEFVLADQSDRWTARLCWDPSDVPKNLTWLVTTNLPALFGGRHDPFSVFNIRSRLDGGHVWTLIPLAVVLGLPVVAWVRRRLSTGSTAADGPPARDGVPATAFPAYIALTGIQATLVYALFSCVVDDYMLIRYTVLALFVPVGLVAWFLRVETSPGLRAACLAAVLVWAVGAAVDDGRLLHEYMRHPPRGEYRALAQYLEDQKVTVGIAGYWTAYQVDFFSDERVILASADQVRILSYQQKVNRMRAEAVRIRDRPCEDPKTAFLRWCIIPPPQ